MKRPDASSSLNKSIILSIMLLLGILPAAADELDDLKKQVEILAKRIEQLENQRNQANQVKTETPSLSEALSINSTKVRIISDDIAGDDVIPPPTDKAITTGDIPGSYKIPVTNTSIRVHGIAQAFVSYDFAARPESESGNESSSAGNIAIEGNPSYEKRGDTRISARDSRMGVSTYTPTNYGPFRTMVEGDFNGPPNDKSSRSTANRSGFGLRHAYGQIGGFLLGQTNTNFMDISAFSEKLDGGGPIGRTFIRQGQLRYTWNFDNGSRFVFALENPKGDFEGADDDILEDSGPDLTANYRYQADGWHMQFSGMLRRMGIDDGIPGGVNDDVMSWGLQNSAAIFLGDSKDRISWMINFGDGIGRYVESGADQGASITRDGKLDNQFGYGGFISYRHWWTGTLRTNIDIGMMKFRLNPLEESLFPLAEAEKTRAVYQSRTNLIWSPIDNYAVGMEWVMGQREIHDGREGKLRRLLFTSIYEF